MRAYVRVYKKASKGGIFSHYNPCRSFTVRKGRTQRKVNRTSEGGCAIRESPPVRTAVGAPHRRPAGCPGSAGGAQRPAGEPRPGAEGAGEQLLPQPRGLLCAYDCTARGRRRGPPAFAVPAISCSSRYIRFYGALKALVFAWEYWLGLYLFLFKFPRSHTLLRGVAGG